MTIELKNISRTYKKTDGSGEVQAVKNVSLKIPENQIFGIIGKSGAGKSTLVRLISLLENADSGEILYGGKRVDNLSEKELIQQRRRIGMIFQNFNLFSSRNAAQNVAYPLEICGVPRKEIAARVAELLELVGLSDRASAPVSTLSGGQKQRVAIARALANKPDILFCDEATSALDPQTTKSILNLIREIQKKMNLTVVMITHQMEVVRDACHNVAVVNEGEIVESGSVEQIFSNAKSETTIEFLSNLSNLSSTRTSDDSKIVNWSSSTGKYILHFTGKMTDEPVLNMLARKFNIEFNICGGGIQSVQGKKVGILRVDFSGSEQEINSASEYLNANGVIVEKISEDVK